MSDSLVMTVFNLTISNYCPSTVIYLCRLHFT